MYITGDVRSLVQARNRLTPDTYRSRLIKAISKDSNLVESMISNQECYEIICGYTGVGFVNGKMESSFTNWVFGLDWLDPDEDAPNFGMDEASLLRFEVSKENYIAGHNVKVSARESKRKTKLVIDVVKQSWQSRYMYRFTLVLNKRSKLLMATFIYKRWQERDWSRRVFVKDMPLFGHCGSGQGGIIFPSCLTLNKLLDVLTMYIYKNEG